jgi:hypothetical protein
MPLFAKRNIASELDASCDYRDITGSWPAFLIVNAKRALAFAEYGRQLESAFLFHAVFLCEQQLLSTGQSPRQ